MNKSYISSVDRNFGIITKSEQEVIYRSNIAVAGCGADGGAPTISLTRLGFRNFRLADPDSYEISNLNRQEGATISNIGRNKAVVISEHIKDIDKHANVVIYDEGLNKQNLAEFVNDADIIVEEIDYRSMEIAKDLYSLARKNNIPVVTAIAVGWGAYGFYFDPKKMSFDEYLHNNEIKDYNNIESAPFVPNIPKYISADLVKDIFQERVHIPVIEPAVKMSAALLAFLVYSILTGRKKIQPVPHFYQLGDLLEN